MMADDKSKRDVKAEVACENIGDRFKGLPMKELIGGPLLAAVDAQEQIAAASPDIYKNFMGGKEDDNKSDRSLEFYIERPVVGEDGKSVSVETQKVQAPLIGLVPIPSLMIERIDVDFQMEAVEADAVEGRSENEVKVPNSWFADFRIAGGASGADGDNDPSTPNEAEHVVDADK